MRRTRGPTIAVIIVAAALASWCVARWQSSSRPRALTRSTDAVVGGAAPTGSPSRGPDRGERRAVRPASGASAPLARGPRGGDRLDDHAPARELLDHPRAGLATALFEREARNEPWARAAERAIAPGIAPDLDAIGGRAIVECRTLGCRVRADAPVAFADELLARVQLVPCAIGTVDGEGEHDGQYTLDFYCFFDAEQGDPAVFTARYADIYQKMRANLAAARAED